MRKYYHTLKYIQPVQVYGRIFSVIRKRLTALASELYAVVNSKPAVKTLKTGLSAKTGFLFHDPWNTGENILKGYFTFLNIQKHLNFPPDWHVKTDDLWRSNLHYLAWLHLLPENEKLKAVKDWIRKNGLDNSAAWQPHAVSLRIVNLIKENLRDPEIAYSIYRQSSYLYNNLEYYHPANHYLENAKALIFAGIYFGKEAGADKWLQKGCSILENELTLQVLIDGAHFELSVMYHAVVLEGLLDILNILPKRNDYYIYFRRHAEKMLRFLASATHPGGEIALLNDSAAEIAPPTGMIMNYAERLGVKLPAPQEVIEAYPDAGYYMIRDENIYLIIDGGSVGPDNIPAHAHADIFNYELSVKGEKFIVDSGVYEYKAGEMREYARSTAAHNTVSIDGISQAECWGSFGMARRYPPEEIRLEKGKMIFGRCGNIKIGNDTEKENSGSVYFSGVYNGYAKLIGDQLKHQREIYYEDNLHRICVKDTVEGSGRHTVKSYIHIHPDVVITKARNKLILKRDGRIVFLSSDMRFRVLEGWYSPEFGTRIRNTVVEFEAEVPCLMQYWLHSI